MTLDSWQIFLFIFCFFLFFWYPWYYPHISRDSVSPVYGIYQVNWYVFSHFKDQDRRLTWSGEALHSTLFLFFLNQTHLYLFEIRQIYKPWGKRWKVWWQCPLMNKKNSCRLLSSFFQGNFDEVIKTIFRCLSQFKIGTNFFL